MKLNNREISAIASEIKNKAEKETQIKRDAFIEKFMPEAKKWHDIVSKMPKCLRNTYHNTDAESMAKSLAQNDKNYPKDKYSYSHNIENVIVLSMIDAKDMADLIKKVEAYKF